MGSAVSVRFYEELNDHLPSPLRKKTLTAEITDGSTVADVLAEYRVPREEVDLVLVNGASEPLRRILRDGDRIAVYPAFESFDIATVTRVRETPLRWLCFAVDEALASLSPRLVAAGYPTVLVNDRAQALAFTARGWVLLKSVNSPLAAVETTRMHTLSGGDTADLIRQIGERFQLDLA